MRMLLFRGPTGATAGNAVTVENVQTVVSVLGTAPAIVPQIAPGMTIQTTLMVGITTRTQTILTIQIHVKAQLRDMQTNSGKILIFIRIVVNTQTGPPTTTGTPTLTGQIIGAIGRTAEVALPVVPALYALLVVPVVALPADVPHAVALVVAVPHADVPAVAVPPVDAVVGAVALPADVPPAVALVVGVPHADVPAVAVPLVDAVVGADVLLADALPAVVVVVADVAAAALLVGVPHAVAVVDVDVAVVAVVDVDVVAVVDVVADVLPAVEAAVVALKIRET